MGTIRGAERNANITRFMEFVNKRYGESFCSYSELYQWSINNIPNFWSSLWDFCRVKASKKADEVVDDPTKMPGAKWFTGARLNFAENLLRYRDKRTAFIFRGETQKKARISYEELYHAVASLTKSLRSVGITSGDRVVGYMPNMIETAIAMLATTSLGGIWSSCATDIGPGAALDRFAQIEPKVLFTADGYFYKGKTFNTLSNAARVVKGIKSIEKAIVAPYTKEKPDLATCLTPCTGMIS